MTGLSAHIVDIARRVLGEPNRDYSSRTELRFGSRGSISVEIAGPKQGQWYDHENSIGGGPWELVQLKGNVNDDEIGSWLERDIGIRQPNGHDRSRSIAATYDYRDETGKLLFEVVRFDTPKDFRQRRPDGTWSIKGVRRVLYRLPELIAAPIDERVYITEGEKDANRLASLDLVATTNPGGAAKRKDDGTPGKSKWRAEYNEFFAGRRVYILPDNDDAGRDHARLIAAELAPIARSVAIVDLPGLGPKGDVSDWLNAGGTRDELLTLADNTIPVQPSDGEITQAEINAEQSRQQQALAILIKKFNGQYAVVNEAGKVLVFEQRADPMLKRKVIVRFTFDNFRKLYQHERLTVTTTTSAGKMVSSTKTMADWWLDHRERRQYPGGVVFDPTSKSPKNYWNLWDGFAVEPAPGDWSLMQEHVRKVICAGDVEHYEYLLDLVARLFQYPAEPAEVAIVMRGDEGVGKGIFARFITRAFGQHGIQISSAAHLVGNFNAYLRDCVVLFADEAFFAGDKQHEGRLKALVTEEMITIEAKYQNVVTVKNMLHLILASNADWVIPASLQARRWFMLDVPDSVRGDRKYFSNLYTQMEEGGLAAMIHDLLRRDITNFDPRAVPTTKALVEQQVHSLDSLHKWWLAVLERSFLYRSRHRVPVLHEWSDFYTTELLWQSYSQWCDENRVYRRQSREDLGALMTTLYKKSRPRSRHPLYEIEVIDVDPFEKRGNWLNEEAVLWKDHQPGYLVGSLPEARTRFTEIYRVGPRSMKSLAVRAWSGPP